MCEGVISIREENLEKMKETKLAGKINVLSRLVFIVLYYDWFNLLSLNAQFFYAQ